MTGPIKTPEETLATFIKEYGYSFASASAATDIAVAYKNARIALDKYYKTKVKFPEAFCNICWTSSWAPCPKDYPHAQKVIKGKDEYVVCQMCQADRRVLDYAKKESLERLDLEKLKDFIDDLIGDSYKAGYLAKSIYDKFGKQKGA